MKELNQSTVAELVNLVDQGLCSGLGSPAPGKMCVEAAVCFALGLPHGDEPGCVSPVIRAMKIRLNDSRWSSNTTRAKGLRKLAVLQLGTKEGFDEKEFIKRVITLLREEIIPRAKSHVNAAAAAHAANAAAAYADAAAAANAAYADAAANAAAYAANAAANAAHAAADAAADAGAAARDRELQFFSDRVSDILIGMNVPGVQWLPLLN